MTQLENAIERMKFTIFAHSSDTKVTDREIVKLMTDLRHLCDSLGLDYYGLSDRAFDWYQVERDEAARPVDRRREGV
jgi:hypothetical protein